ncbi:MAG: protein phosphatase 2C domain-containing protein [Chloroflexota bacterium]
MERAQIGNDLNVGYATHEGMSGKHNEDNFGMFAWKLPNGGIFYLGVVADGVGGQSAGEVASQLTVDAIKNYFDQQTQVENNVSAHLERAIQIANETVHRASRDNPEQRGMSTTVAAVAFINDRMYTAYVGDSRIYLMRDGQLRQISIDHTWAQEAIEAGLLTREQAKTHPNRNVIRRHLGGQMKVQVDHRLAIKQGQSAQEMQANQGLRLRASDTVLICSDGLTDMISDGAVHESLQKHFYDLPTGAQELVDKANRAGGRDNITLVIMQVPGEAQPMAAMPVGGAVAAAAAAKRTTRTETTTTTMAPPATPVMTQPAAAEKKGGRGATWLVIGGVVALALLAAVVGLVFIISNSMGGDEPTPTVPVILGTVPPGVTLPAGAPATAAILATQGALGTPGVDGSGPEEPELIPTLRSTLTETPIILPTATPTSRITATPTPTRPSSGGPGPAATPTRTPVPSTSTPTNTPAPSTSTPTNTPAPPTSTPTTIPQPPTSTPTEIPPPPTEQPTEAPPVPTTQQ